jgi:hypothetical protein
MTDGTTRFRSVTYPPAGDVRVTFRVPEDWKEDANLPGMALYYPEPEDAPGGGPWPVGGMLAVNVEAKPLSPPLSAEAADRQVRSKSKDPSQVRRLDVETWLIRGKSYKQEASHRAVVHLWVLVRLVRPDLLVRVGFVFSAIDMLYDEPGKPFYGVVEMLEREVGVARVEAV